MEMVNGQRVWKGTIEEEDDRTDLYLDEAQHERRIQVLKEIILVREEKQQEKIDREWLTYGDVDGSRGECCCYWRNDVGSNYVQKFD